MGIYTRNMPDNGEWGLLKLSPKEAARAMVLRGLDDIDIHCSLHSILFTQWADPEREMPRGSIPTPSEMAEIQRHHFLIMERIRTLITKGVALPYEDVRDLGNPTLDDF